ncbi:MAG: peptidase M24 [Bacteroidetes bacterium HGW-Bacteroidetes-15]|nr:MAG: peptidase M24 [Bacteroidetes bacterium HGW-Bacteroidetes-15]
MKTIEKISKLRSLMASKRISAYIIPSSDPHLSEYLPDCWKFRAWISGFTGSAGTLVVTSKDAALWTDSRYFLQAENELKDSGIELCKIGLPDTPTMESWIANKLNKKQVVGFDGRLFAHGTAKKHVADLEKSGLKVNFNTNYIYGIWDNRPNSPNGKAFEHELRFAGQTVEEKIEKIRIILEKEGANSCLISALDEVAWTFNLRGSDVDYNPVVLSYGFISKDEAILFIDSAKLDESLIEKLEEHGVEVEDYTKVEKFIKKLKKNTIIALDDSKVNHQLASLIPKKLAIKPTLSIPTRLKAIKNAVELENVRQSHVLDGIAMCEFLYWLEHKVGKEHITELTIAEKLFEFRKRQNGFVSESFGTIAGYLEHGAIVHYGATEGSASVIKPEGFLLVDSGGQYNQGTTDVTRTVHLSTPNKEEKTDYTLVLKGMIQLSMIQFPAGTRGSQIDILARMAMWRKGINYGHGTGHGVGAFLNVHEGPQSIRPNENPVTIEPGMIQSNEPAIYRAGKYGIRIENLIACKKAYENEYGIFYNFETLTLCPIDLKPVDIKMLTHDEREWLNEYHRMVYEKLAPGLSVGVKDWLAEKTKAV